MADEQRAADAGRDSPRPARPAGAPERAATVILIRDGQSGLETLMLRRNSKLAFGGMWVFPGGRVDAADGGEGDADVELEAARRAAVREAHEEAGLALSAGSLVPFSHWTPPPIAPRRFLTWFFIAVAPADAVRIDRGEIHDHAWMRPADALARRDAGEIELAPPTFVTLWDLAAQRDCEAALAHARSRRPPRFATRVVKTASGPLALWDGDAGYGDGDTERPGPRHRLLMHRGVWRYECSATAAGSRT